MVTCSRDLVLSKASRKGRECAHRARLLLLFLLLFSSFSFASSSIETDWSCPGTSSGYATEQDACSTLGGTVNSKLYCVIPSSGSQLICAANNFLTCSVPPGTVDTGSNAPTSGSSFCASNSDCEESVMATYGSGVEIFATNGNACIPVAANSSTPNNCPSGYSSADSTGCSCSNSSGDFVPSNNADTNPSCNGGSSTAPTLSPVSPVSSGGTTSCPSGDASITYGSSVSCYSVVVPPAVNSGSSGTIGGSGGGGSGGGSSGGSSSFHTVSPVTSSNGQLTCPPGDSSISGANGSDLTCIASGSGSGGSGTSPTASGSSGTAPTSSGQSYPTSISMPSMPGDSVQSIALSQIPGASESTSQQCPAPITFTIMNHTFSISFSYACTLAAKVRPIVVGGFSLASLVLLVK